MDEQSQSTSKSGKGGLCDEIDLILAGRKPKESVELPDYFVDPSKRLRTVVLEDEEFEHLLGEVTGTLYNYPGRPELDLLTVGIKPIDEGDQNSLFLLFDACKCMYVFSEKIELILLQQIKEGFSSHIQLKNSICKYAEVESCTLNLNQKKIFRRLIREYFERIHKESIKPKTDIKEKKSPIKDINKPISFSDSDSEDSSKLSVKGKKKSKSSQQKKKGINRTASSKLESKKGIIGSPKQSSFKGSIKKKS